MLEVLVRNANGNLSQHDRDYATKKLGKLDRYFHSASRVELAYREDKTGHRIEVTVFADGVVLHGMESDPHVHAAIDKVADKLENRLRRVKSKLVKRLQGRGTPVAEDLLSLPDQEFDDSTFTEERGYSLKPISPEEAVLQMELTDYPFYVFRNMETGNVEVVYRTDKGHGIVFAER